MLKGFAPPALAALVLLAGGCVQKGMDTINVDGICSLPDTCSFSAGACSTFELSRPVVDVSLANSLQLYLNVRNQLPVGGEEGSTTNTHDAQVKDASISYDAAGGGALALGGSSMDTFGTVPAAGAAVVKVYVIPEEAMVRLAALGVPAFTPTAPNYWEYVARVRLSGTYQDTSKFESGDFEVPFRVCNGCLTPCATGVTCPPNNDGQTPAICAAP